MTSLAGGDLSAATATITKRLLRWVFDHLQTDMAFNMLLATGPLRQAASLVYFHRKGVFEHAGTAIGKAEARRR